MNRAAKLALVLGLAFSIILMLAMWKMHSFGSPVMDSASHILNTAAQEVKSANIVCAIVLDYRGLDTLGEATILLAAIAGTIAVLKVGKK